MIYLLFLKINLNVIILRKSKVALTYKNMLMSGAFLGE